MTEEQSQALAATLEERRRQDAKWGEQNHEPATWMLIAAEEFGEISQAILQHKPVDYRKELVQLTAVMLAWLESEFRNEGTNAHKD